MKKESTAVHTKKTGSIADATGKKAVAKSKSNQENSQVVESKSSSNGTAGLLTKKDWILSGKIKAAYCEACNTFAPRVFVGEWKPSDKPKDDDDELLTTKTKKVKYGNHPPSENQYWLRCPNCMQVQLVKEWQIQIDREPSLDELTPEDCTKYSPQGIYAIGDAIFHPTINDAGIVRSKQTTASGVSVIMVEFKREGHKQLLENVAVRTDGTSKAVVKKGNKKLKIKKS